MTYNFTMGSEFITCITGSLLNPSDLSTNHWLTIVSGIYLLTAVIATAALGYDEILHRQAIIKAKSKQSPKVAFAELPDRVQFGANQEKSPSCGAQEVGIKRKEEEVATFRPVKRVQLEPMAEIPIRDDQSPRNPVADMQMRPLGRPKVQSWKEVVDSLGSMDFD